MDKSFKNLTFLRQNIEFLIFINIYSSSNIFYRDREISKKVVKKSHLSRYINVLN